MQNTKLNQHTNHKAKKYYLYFIFYFSKTKKVYVLFSFPPSGAFYEDINLNYTRTALNNARLQHPERMRTSRRHKPVARIGFENRRAITLQTHTNIQNQQKSTSKKIKIIITNSEKAKELSIKNKNKKFIFKVQILLENNNWHWHYVLKHRVRSLLFS